MEPFLINTGSKLFKLGQQMKYRKSIFLLFFLMSFNIVFGNTKSHETGIDCPLRKQGIDVHGMRPFENTKKYIEFLEKNDRSDWQKPDAVVSYLQLKGSEIIADIGAGSGYFSFRFAGVLTKGKVLAIDIEPEMLRYIHHKSMSLGIKNIEVLLASHDDPKVPRGIDMVFMCDVLHHIKNRAVWLSKLSSEVRKGAKLILIEFKEGALPEGPPEKMKISNKEILSIVGNNGFKLLKQNTDLLPYQYIYEFEKN